MKDIVIIGAGGFGREVLWLIEEINLKEKIWNFIGFVDDYTPVGEVISGYPVLGSIEWLKNQSLGVVCAVGDPLTKKKILNKLVQSNNYYPILIHPETRKSNRVDIGEGTIICAGCIITVDISIGSHVIINLDCTIGHDALISNYSTILPSVNVSGNVHIDECVSIGTGSQIIQKVSIGKNSIIGAGSVVTKDIPKNVVAVGIPAKPIKERVFEED